eukprot:SAG22_NODE_609_length_8597_cov_12.875382_9_plen_123_part_00
MLVCVSEHAQTDQAHGAVCVWSDGEPESADNIPGCSTCKDEGAVEPFLNCSYSLGPGAHVNSRESFTSFRVMALATDSDQIERQAVATRALSCSLPFLFLARQCFSTHLCCCCGRFSCSTAF